VRELRGTAPELSERAALRALELCGGCEEDAILRVTEEAAFKRRCMADAGDAALGARRCGAGRAVSRGCVLLLRGSVLLLSGCVPC